MTKTPPVPDFATWLQFLAASLDLRAAVLDETTPAEREAAKARFDEATDALAAAGVPVVIAPAR